MPYTDPFLAETKKAVSSPTPLDDVANLTKHPMYKSAHPTDEHFLGLPVAVAATDKNDTVEPIFVGVDKDIGLGWGFWRWTSA